MSNSTGRLANADGSYLTTPVQMTGMPSGIPYIIGNEAAERFSYYGMNGILFAFLTEYLRNSAGEMTPLDVNVANQWVHYFIMAVYAFPLVGAILSDWLFGKYRMIVWVSILYCLGHGLLALMDFPAVTHLEPKVMLAMGLGLIALGAGGIKPCVSAHVGDQFGELNKHLIPKVFSWFYFSINAGSAVSMFLTPWLLKNHGPGWAFGVPGVLMVLATIVFWMGRYKFVHIPPSGREFFKETLSDNGVRAVVNLVPLYIMVLPFFSLFDQQHSSWVEQAKSMNCMFFGYEILPSQIQAVNPVLILILIPMFSYGFYPLAAKFCEVTPLRKVGAGLVLAMAAYVVIWLAQIRIDAGARPHFSWQILAYVIMTAAEVLVSITVLEFSYTQAPKTMKSFVMGIFLFFSMAMGNLFTALVNEYISVQKKSGSSVLQGANYFLFFTIVIGVTTLVFLVWSQFYRGRTFIQGEAD
ncbi:MAG: POT family MFS transporter [Pirellulales bacterium]